MIAQKVPIYARLLFSPIFFCHLLRNTPVLSNYASFCNEKWYLPFLKCESHLIDAFSLRDIIYIRFLSTVPLFFSKTIPLHFYYSCASLGQLQFFIRPCFTFKIKRILWRPVLFRLLALPQYRRVNVHRASVKFSFNPLLNVALLNELLKELIRISAFFNERFNILKG